MKSALLSMNRSNNIPVWRKSKDLSKQVSFWKNFIILTDPYARKWGNPFIAYFLLLVQIIKNLKMIFIASDHAGYDLKESLKELLEEMMLEYVDIGPHAYDELDDYPDYIYPAAKKVAEDPDKHKGIVIGGSGQGEAIVANKVKGIRAGLYHGGPEEIVSLTRTHNNANVLALGARFLTSDQAREAVRRWLGTSFPGEERHHRRIEKISQLENDQ
jgi:ribose 5-phosphate isomerase B